MMDELKVTATSILLGQALRFKGRYGQGIHCTPVIFNSESINGIKEKSRWKSSISRCKESKGRN
jgi:hypothetical protein